MFTPGCTFCCDLLPKNILLETRRCLHSILLKFRSHSTFKYFVSIRHYTNITYLNCKHGKYVYTSFETVLSSNLKSINDTVVPSIRNFKFLTFQISATGWSNSVGCAYAQCTLPLDSCSLHPNCILDSPHTRSFKDLGGGNLSPPLDPCHLSPQI